MKALMKLEFVSCAPTVRMKHSRSACLEDSRDPFEALVCNRLHILIDNEHRKGHLPFAKVVRMGQGWADLSMLEQLFVVLKALSHVVIEDELTYAHDITTSAFVGFVGHKERLQPTI